MSSTLLTCLMMTGTYTSQDQGVHPVLPVATDQNLTTMTPSSVQTIPLSSLTPGAESYSPQQAMQSSHAINAPSAVPSCKASTTTISTCWTSSKGMYVSLLSVAHTSHY